MYQINMYEAKTDLSKLVKMLEEKIEDKIILARSGKPVAYIMAINEPSPSKRIGIAKNKIKIDDAFYNMDSEIEKLFSEAIG